MMARFIVLDNELINIDHIVRIYDVDSAGHTRLELSGGHVFDSYSLTCDGIGEALALAGATVDTIAEETVFRHQKNKKKVAQ